MFRLVPVTGSLPDQIGILEAEACADSVKNVSRLVADWTNGEERFSKPGELLLAAYDGERLIAIGGLTVDPYHPTPPAMRLRRVYVLKQDRGLGVGRALASALIEHGLKRTNLLLVNAGVQDADLFWEALGFERVDRVHHSHEMRVLPT
jgi:GNAT superfamily N-acetyltransferase